MGLNFWFWNSKFENFEIYQERNPREYQGP